MPTGLSFKRGTLIDNFLCKFSHGFLQTTAAIVPCGISDHFPLLSMLGHFSIYQQKSPICKSKNTWPRRNKQFKSEIRNSDMTSKLTLNLRANPNENYNVLTTTLSKAMEKSMPTKLVKFNKKDIKNLNGLRKISLIQLLTEIKCKKKLCT